MATFTWTALDSLMAKLGRFIDPDPTSMLVEWEKIIDEDNRRGVLAGEDKDGDRMDPVRYRPKPAGSKRRWTKRQEATHRGRRGVFDGLGPYASGFDDNLTNSQYLRLSGPPLAPRGANSRVIKNLHTEHGQDPGSDNRWFAVGAWADVVSNKGVKFLPFHFNGAGRLPIRDLRGVRPAGKLKALRAMQRWAATLLRGT